MRWTRWLTLASLAGACEPVTTNVIEVTLRDASVHDARMPARDKGSEIELEQADPDGCLELRDQFIPELNVDAAVFDSRFVIARNSAVGSCTEGDAGTALTTASVYARRDGLPMVERGQRYSFSWPSLTTSINRLHLVGGDAFCADREIVDVDYGGYKGSQLGLATCHELVSPIDALYVRIDGRDYPSLQWINLGMPPLRFKLCPSPCPAGTMHEFVDAGTP